MCFYNRDYKTNSFKLQQPYLLSRKKKHYQWFMTQFQLFSSQAALLIEPKFVLLLAWIYSVFFALPIAATQLKHQKTKWLDISEFLQKIENLDIFPSKREISRWNGRTGDNFSKRESPVQNGRFGKYVQASFYSEVFFNLISISNDTTMWDKPKQSQM